MAKVYNPCVYNINGFYIAENKLVVWVDSYFCVLWSVFSESGILAYLTTKRNRRMNGGIFIRRFL